MFTISRGSSHNIAITLGKNIDNDSIEEILLDSSDSAFLQSQSLVRVGDFYFIKLTPLKTSSAPDDFNFKLIIKSSSFGVRVSQLFRLRFVGNFSSISTAETTGIDSLITIEQLGDRVYQNPAIINISKGPKGDKGDKGEKGEKGERGERGFRGNSITDVDVVGNAMVITIERQPDITVPVPALTQASQDAASALQSKNEAKQSELSALSSKNAAQISEQNAAQSEGAATIKANEALSFRNAAQSAATSASASEQVATIKANEVSSQVSIATTKANEANVSAQIASTKASEASISAQNATTSESLANQHKLDAAQSATLASGYYQDVDSRASDAEASAVSALSSKNAAQASEQNAITQANIATSAASAALASEEAAANSEQVATTQATTATEQATIATTGANTATVQAGIATTAATSASASASQSAASASQAAAVSLQQSFGRKFVPTISLDSTSRTVPSYLHCTRAGVATFFDPSGVLRTANANEGRIDFDPVTGECLGLLDEEAATTLTNSTTEGFNLTFGGNRVDLGTTNSPVQSARVYEFTPTATGGGISVQTSAVPTNVFLGASVFLRAETTERYCYLRLVPGGQNASAGVIIINLQTGVATPFSIGGSPTTGLVFSVTRNAGFWYVRIFSSATNQTAGALLVASLLPCAANGSTTSIHPAIAYSSLFTFTAPTRVFPTHVIGAINLTRPADLFATTGFQFARRYNQREGTFYINTRAISDLTSTLVVFSDGTTNNETRLLANGTLTIRKGGVQIASIQATGATLNTHSIFGFTYKGTRVVITRNGTTVGVVTASEELATNYTQFQLGTGIYVRNLRYIPRALSDSELQFVTNPLYFVGLEGDKVPAINDLSSGAFMDLEDIYAANPEIQTFFGIGSAQTIVINRPYPFTLRQVYLSPSGVTSSTLPTLPSTGFFAANTDYNIVFNATNVSQLTISITRVLV